MSRKITRRIGIRDSYGAKDPLPPVIEFIGPTASPLKFQHTVLRILREKASVTYPNHLPLAHHALVFATDSWDGVQEGIRVVHVGSLEPKSELKLCEVVEVYKTDECFPGGTPGRVLSIGPPLAPIPTEDLLFGEEDCCAVLGYTGIPHGGEPNE